MTLSDLFKRAHRTTLLKIIGVAIVASALFFMYDEEAVRNSRKLGSLAETFGATPVLWGMRIFLISVVLFLLWALPDGAKSDETIDRIARRKHQIDNSIRREK
ncbi:MAG: hypothetical protein AAGC58_05210 [Asticcacaulis sp.]